MLPEVLSCVVRFCGACAGVSHQHTCGAPAEAVGTEAVLCAAAVVSLAADALVDEEQCGGPAAPDDPSADFGLLLPQERDPEDEVDPGFWAPGLEAA